VSNLLTVSGRAVQMIARPAAAGRATAQNARIP